MQGSPRVLVVDDDDSFRCLLTQELAQTFPEARAAESAASALRQCREGDFDVVLLDIRMPDQDGLQVLRQLKAQAFDGEVIMLTGHATLDSAISSLKTGAYDYLTKPCKLEELESIVRKAFEKRQLRKQNWKLREVLQRQSTFNKFVGDSESLQQVLALVRKLAATDSTVLIYGQSGVGKELVARAIHGHSVRASQPFVVVDCARLLPDLLQSELFGHERGSFTGAVALKRGLFEVADTGTLLLDEIGELSPEIQARLLHVLENRSFRRVGGLRDITVDVRILAATHRDLEAMVEEGSFRQDLYYRINVVSLRVPPLRERAGDIRPLAEHFVRLARTGGKRCPTLDPGALEMLQQYSWPGNVRELRNVMERAVVLADGDVIQSRHLPENLRPPEGAPLAQLENSLPSLRELEQLYIRNLLNRFSGHRARIASALGISERSLYRKLREYDLDKRPFSS